MAAPHPNHRAYLAGTIAALVLLGLLPARYGRWMNAIGDKAFLLVGPVTAPVYKIVRWATPTAAPQSDEVAALQREVDRYKQLYLNTLREAEDDRRKYEALSKGAFYTPPPEAQLLRPVIGATAEPGGRITVRAGKRDGVEVNTVATTVGVQLVGRVIEVSSRICTVRLINDRATGGIKGRVMASDTVRGSPCLLYPVTDGQLQGYVSVEGPDQPPGIGQLVRLEDEKWPRTSQMLVIGSVTFVQRDPTGRPIITVRPTTDLERLAEVVLRISPQESDDRAAAPAPADGGNP
jgi:cell shape-determining protein MreC